MESHFWPKEANLMPQGNDFGVRQLIGDIICQIRDERGLKAIEDSCRVKKIDCSRKGFSSVTLNIHNLAISHSILRNYMSFRIYSKSSFQWRWSHLSMSNGVEIVKKQR